MLTLKYQTDYLSIKNFNDCQISNLTVITGQNGSGKSHLLRAIKNKNVTIEGVSDPNIVLFNYENFRLQNESAFNGHLLAQEKQKAWQQLQQIKNNILNYRNKIPSDKYEKLKDDCIRESAPLYEFRIEYSVVNNFFKNLKTFLTNLSHNSKQQYTVSLLNLAQELPFSLDEIDEPEFFRLFRPYQERDGFLPNQVGKIFWDYYLKYRENQINLYENKVNSREYPAISEEEFIFINGPKPWEMVNEILKQFDSLKYRVNSPEGQDIFGNYQLKLTHLNNPELEIQFNDLSSGERVMMALVVSVYKASTNTQFPDLILLDEVDASLHPAMMKNMLDIIENIFLSRGIIVLFVTHSPSTVALSPDDSLLLMHPSGDKRIEKCTKKQALKILTQGYTLLEEGLEIIQGLSESELTIITEGSNTKLISAALEHYQIDGVKMLSGIESSSGKHQLKTIFDFLSKINGKTKIMIIWDCDFQQSLVTKNNVYPFSIPINENNSMVRKGIENLFPEDLFEGFKKTITLSKGEVKHEFDQSRKSDFCEFIISRQNPADFMYFDALIDEIVKFKSHV